MSRRAWAALLVAVAACRKPASAAPKPTAPVTAGPIPKFDVHTHIAPDGMARAMSVLLPNGVVGAVNLSGGDDPEILAHQLREAATVGQGRVSSSRTSTSGMRWPRGGS